MPLQSGSLGLRLRWYWWVEAANAVIVPLAVWRIFWPSGEATGALFWVAAAACSSLLLIAGLYWRAVLRRIRGAPAAYLFWLPRIAAAEKPCLALIVATAIMIVAAIPGADIEGIGKLLAAGVLLMLALLEYVNYYKVQLQHFDNAADFRRLLAGRGFRKAHLARDIAAWRAEARRNRQSR